MSIKKIAILATSVAGLSAMAPAVAAQDLNVCSQESLTQIVYYEFGKAQSAETASQIQGVQGLASTCDVRSIELIGHTDTVGSAATNQRLSVRRADNMKAELVRMGVPGNLIMTSGRGETELFIPTADGTQEQLNRRVEVRFTFNPMMFQTEQVYVEADPVYVEAEPVFVESTPAEVFVQPDPVYVEATPYVDTTPYVEATRVVEAAPVIPAAPAPAPIAAPVATSGNSGLLLFGAAAAAAAGIIIIVSDDDDEPTSP